MYVCIYLYVRTYNIDTYIGMYMHAHKQGSAENNSEKNNNNNYNI